MSIFDVGLGVLALIGAAAVAVGILVYREYRSWKTEWEWSQTK